MGVWVYGVWCMVCEWMVYGVWGVVCECMMDSVWCMGCEWMVYGTVVYCTCATLHCTALYLVSMASSVSLPVSSWRLLSTRETAVVVVERESGSTTGMKRATVRGYITKASDPALPVRSPSTEPTGGQRCQRKNWALPT
jgi:hypothetical protein